jgi:hypothetical protein
LLVNYRHHKRWIFFTGSLLFLASVAYYHLAPPGGPRANSVIGIWFGIAATLCMVYAASLSLLRWVPSWWFIGSRQWWMRGHIWLGSLSLALVFFHSAGRLGGLLEQVLWALVGLVIGTGLLGLGLQQIVPNLLATRFAEVPYEQIPHECEVLRRKANGYMEMLCGPHDIDPQTAPPKLGHPALDARTKIRLRNIYETVVRPFLGWPYLRSSALADLNQAEIVYGCFRELPQPAPISAKAKDELTGIARELERLCKDRRHLGEQERLYHWLHLWLFAHVPPAALLIVLGSVHGFVSLFY